MIDTAALINVLSSVYDTALSEDAWPGTLDSLRTLFNCHFADIFQRVTDFSIWRGQQVGLDERDYQDVFLGTWVKNNVWGRRRPPRRSGDIVTTREMISKRDLQRSDMYFEYLHPRELQEGLRFDLRADAHGIEDLSLLRPWSAGAFTDEELRAASSLMPHLQRASVIRRRLARTANLADAGLASLDQLEMGVLILSPQGQIAHANHAAERLLRSGDPIRGGSDGLTTRTASSTRALNQLIGAAGPHAPGGSRSGSLQLTDASGKSSMLAVAMPIRPGAHDPFDILRPSTFLCLIDRESHRVPSATHLTDLFGLTPAEASLARDMLTGCNLQEIAERTGRSVHTVRSLLSRLMAKTETNRQSELVRLLARVPHQ